MAKMNSRFRTKLSKAQKRKNILVFIAVMAICYTFVLLFCFALGLSEGSTLLEFCIFSLFMSFFVLSMVLFPVPVAAILLGLQKGKAKRISDDSTFIPVQNIKYYRDSLSELNPSIVSLLMDLDIYGNKDVAATLLRMQNKKIISFKGNRSITILNKNCPQLDNSERELLSIINNGNLNNKKVLSAWKQNRFNDADKLGYIKKKTVLQMEISNKYVLLGFLSFIASMIMWGVFLANDFYIFDTVIEMIRTIVMLLFIDALMFVPFYFLGVKVGYKQRGDVLWERTPLGHETAEKVAGLKQFIHEFSQLSEANKEEVVLWEDYLVYAIVLEENDKIVKEISEKHKIASNSYISIR